MGISIRCKNNLTIIWSKTEIFVKLHEIICFVKWLTYIWYSPRRRMRIARRSWTISGWRWIIMRRRWRWWVSFHKSSWRRWKRFQYRRWWMQPRSSCCWRIGTWTANSWRCRWRRNHLQCKTDLFLYLVMFEMYFQPGEQI